VDGSKLMHGRFPLLTIDKLVILRVGRPETAVNPLNGG